MSVRPKKKLGQHFLTDQNIAQKIVNALLLTNEELVIEVGAGKGILTDYLIDRIPDKLKIIDVDDESIQFLKDKYPGHSEHILKEDFLKSNLFERVDAPVAIIGNLPYNISSQIIFKTLENRSKITEVVCMIQKEVAERFKSGPNTKVYGILSVLIQAFYKVEYLFTVSEKVFHPVPKVKSAVIRLERKDFYHLECDENLFFKIVKMSFGQRRKIIKNSLREFLKEPGREHVLLQKRPEQLSVNEFVELTNFIASKP